jgi:AraC-like DNA-binding protein
VPVGVKGRVAADIISFVEENHTKSISLKALSAKLGYDYNYTSRYFRRAFDMTFSEFLNVYRLQTALSLLEDATLSVTQVAYESGFSSIRNFNTVFREKMNMTPTEYRRGKNGREKDE